MTINPTYLTIGQYTSTESLLVNKTVVTLTNSQIKSLPSVPVTILTLPSGSLFLPIGVFINGAYAVQYGAIEANAVFQVKYATVLVNEIDEANYAFISGGGWYSLPGALSLGASVTHLVVGGGVASGDAGQAFTVSIDNQSGAEVLSGGDDSNFLSVTLYYGMVAP